MAMPPPPPMSHSRLEEGLRPGGAPPPLPPLNEEVPLFVVFMNAINTVTHLLLGAVAITAFICINIVSLLIDLPSITAHVYLTVIGYVFLLSQAVLSLNPQTGWENNFKYPQKKKIYWIMQVIGSLLAFIGGIMGIVAIGKVSDAAHLHTRHQIVGFIALILTTVSLVGGIAHLICTSMVKSSVFKAAYACISTVTLIIAFVAIILAIDEFRGLLLNANTNLAISFSVLSLAGMLTMIIANFVVGGKVII